MSPTSVHNRTELHNKSFSFLQFQDNLTQVTIDRCSRFAECYESPHMIRHTEIMVGILPQTVRNSRLALPNECV